jgi:hypothetical protein
MSPLLLILILILLLGGRRLLRLRPLWRNRNRGNPHSHPARAGAHGAFVV